MNILIGLIAPGRAWEDLCLQEGVPFTTVDLSTFSDVERCSILVINRSLNSDERKSVQAYLEKGGAVLGSAAEMDGVAGTTSWKSRVEYMVPDEEAVFGEVSLMDIGKDCSIPREANALRIQTNSLALFAGPLLGGHAIILPFSVAELSGDNRVADKSFYASSDRLPSERVSLVSRGELRHLLHRSFEYLHHIRGIPYIHLWYFPEGSKNIFAFRVDTDGAPRKDIDDLYRIARDHDIPLTWFLDVKSHEDWLHHFAFMADHEMGVHCYEHLVYPDVQSNLVNIGRAKHLMEVAGVTPVGFAAPFGSWNTALAEVTDKLGFSYASEFSFAYDTFPCYPLNNAIAFSTLQVPIHPICIGSLRKVGYSGRHMMEYFSMTAKRKLDRYEPLFFYHHPSHQRWEVVRSLFEFVKDRSITAMTLGRYASWWERRLSCRWEGFYVVEGEKPVIHVVSDGRIGADHWLHLTKPEGSESFTPFAGVLDLRALHWVPTPASRAPADIRRIRDFDPRKMLRDVYERMVRRLR